MYLSVAQPKAPLSVREIDVAGALDRLARGLTTEVDEEESPAPLGLEAPPQDIPPQSAPQSLTKVPQNLTKASKEGKLPLVSLTSF
jgi:hypothetical protein